MHRKYFLFLILALLLITGQAAEKSRKPEQVVENSAKLEFSSHHQFAENSVESKLPSDVKKTVKPDLYISNKSSVEANLSQPTHISVEPVIPSPITISTEYALHSPAQISVKPIPSRPIKVSAETVLPQPIQISVHHATPRPIKFSAGTLLPSPIQVSTKPISSLQVTHQNPISPVFTQTCPVPTEETLRCLQQWVCQYLIRLDLRCLLNLNGGPLIGSNNAGGLLAGLLGR